MADYAFPKNYVDDEALTLLVVRVYPYKMLMCCWVPGKGRDPKVVARLSRFIRDIGLTHFAYRSDREPAITAMIEEACAASGRKGVKVGPTESSDDIEPEAFVSDGELNTDEIAISDVPKVDDALRVESTHTATPEPPIQENRSRMDLRKVQLVTLSDNCAP